MRKEHRQEVDRGSVGTSILLIMPTGLPQSPCSFHGSASTQEPAGKYPSLFLAWLEREPMAIGPWCFCCARKTLIQSQNPWAGEGTWAAVFSPARFSVQRALLFSPPTPNGERPFLLLFTWVVCTIQGEGCPEKLKPPQTVAGASS